MGDRRRRRIKSGETKLTVQRAMPSPSRPANNLRRMKTAASINYYEASATRHGEDIEGYRLFLSIFFTRPYGH